MLLFLPAPKMHPVRKRPFNAFGNCRFLPHQQSWSVFAASAVMAPYKPLQTSASARFSRFVVLVIPKHLCATCNDGEFLWLDTCFLPTITAVRSRTCGLSKRLQQVSAQSPC